MNTINIEENKKFKILFLCTHLSTGGMPEYVKKKIEALKSYSELDIFVVEYSLYSDSYIIQRQKIIDLVGAERFLSLGWFSSDTSVNYSKFQTLKTLIQKENFDIIHIDDTIETLESFNKFHPELISFLYNGEDTTFKLIETPHSSGFNANDNKLYIPNGFIYCSDYHLHNDYDILNKTIPNCVIEYPIIDKSTDYFTTPFEFKRFKKNIINIGIWTSGKNQKQIIDIARKINEMYPNEYGFHFLGSLASNFEDYWKPIIQDIPTNVIVHGERNDVYSFLKNCDLFIFSSIYELNPIVIKEAISFKNKIILKKLKVYGDIYDNYAQYLSDDIENDSKLVIELIQSSHSYELPTHTLENMGSSILDFYRNVKLHSNKSFIKTSVNRVLISYEDDNICCKLNGDDYFHSYFVSFEDLNTNSVVYRTEIKSNMWAKPFQNNKAHWKVVVTSDNPLFETFVYCETNS